MLVAKRLAGVTPQVNLSNPLCAGDEGSTLALADVIRSPKQRYQCPYKNDQCPSNFF